VIKEPDEKNVEFVVLLVIEFRNLDELRSL